MISEVVSAIASFLVVLFSKIGYLGIFAGMFCESTLIPFPSELILPPAGYLVQQGNFSFVLVYIFAVLGSLLGSLAMYFLGFYVGRVAFEAWVRKYGKFLFFNHNSLCKTENYFENHGEITIFISRLTFGIRHFISLVAGFAKMKFWRFFIYTLIGSGIWNAILICVGYICGQNQELITKNLSLISYTILALCILLVIGYILWNRKKEKCHE